MNAKCQICGNISYYDEITLKSSTYTINGTKIILCDFCENGLLIALKRRFKG